eukprot:164417_1
MLNRYQDVDIQEEENKFEYEIHDNIQHIQLTLPLQNRKRKTADDKMMISQKMYENRDETKPSQKRSSQFIDCKNGHDIKSCMPMQRLIDLLNYCQQNKQSKHTNIYEYLEKFENYGISSLMEDWHQIKLNHRNDDEFNAWVSNNKYMYCDGKTCDYIQRYNRDREQQPYPLELDVPNTILMDQIDSIHSFLFHTLHQRKNVQPFKNIRYRDEEDEKQMISSNIWSDSPDSLKDCSIKQILFIIDHHLFDSLKEQVRNKLMQYKVNIMEYIKINQINGHKLLQMNRKHFISELIKHLNLADNKLKAALGNVYTTITTYDISYLCGKSVEEKQDIWHNQPKSVEECDVNQVEFLLKHKIFDSLTQKIADKLINYKTDIIKYFKEKLVDGSVLTKMNRKTFAAEIQGYLNLTHNKLRQPLCQLYNTIVKYDVLAINNVQNANNKFVTNPSLEQRESNHQYYSFGVQYKYTANLKDHPFYIYPKYAHIKDELFEYLLRINQKSDLAVLLHNQLECIKNMKPSLQEMLTMFITTENVSEIGIICDDADNECKYDDVITLLENSCDALKNIIIELFQFVDKETINNLNSENTIYDYYLQTLRYDLTTYFNKLVQDDDDILYHWKNKKKELTKQNMIFATVPEIKGLMVQNYLFSKWHDIENVMIVCEYIFSHNPNLQNIDEKDMRKQMKQNMKSLNHVDILLLKTKNEIQIHDVFFAIIKISQTRFNTGNFKVSKLKIKDKFVDFAKAELSSKMKANISAYLKKKQNDRMAPYIEKAEIKMKMESVKAMKAAWYQGINDHHSISPNAPLSKEHAFSLIVYSQFTSFCTSFRETYRKIHDNENLSDQILRHSQYGWLARRIYESYVFYASTNNAIATLYHGISIPLVFKTFYCTFDSPTSTTTAMSVASSFGQH